MAVYKPTYCEPFLTNFDARVCSAEETQYFRCHIESSNKDITGYSIRVLNSDNNQVFPLEDKKISPIKELQDFIDKLTLENTGLNGTYLSFPFIQNKYDKILSSYNAIYYVGNKKVNYVLHTDPEYIGTPEYIGSTEPGVDAWTPQINDELTYGGWDGVLNGEVVSVGELVLSLSTEPEYFGIWEITSNGNLRRYETPSVDTIITVINGKFHDIMYQYNSNWSEYNQLSWEDCNGNRVNINNSASTYKWIVTLYQGSETVGYTAVDNFIIPNTDVSSQPWEMDYSNLSFDWYDMILNSGEVLGSNSKRLQLADNATDPQKLPGEGTSEGLVLQGRYVQLLDNNEVAHYPRAYVQSFDSSFGHVYPIDGSFTEDQINLSSKARFYKYTNNDEGILAGDKVKCASKVNIRTGSLVTFKGVTLNGQQPSDPKSLIKINFNTLNNKIKMDTAEDIRFDYDGTNWTISNFTEDSGNIKISDYGISINSTIVSGDYFIIDFQRFGVSTGTPSDYTTFIDGVSVSQGDWVLLMNQENPQDNGVFSVDLGAGWTRNGITDANWEGFGWGRPAAYDTWAEYLGKFIFVEQGNQCGLQNFQSQATRGGVLKDGASGASLGNNVEYSPLYFNEEQPIVLFPEAITHTATYAALSEPLSSSDYQVDGYKMAVGDTVLLADTKEIKQLQDNQGIVSLITIESNIMQCNISLGKEYGNHSVQIINSDYEIVYTAQTCSILKNTQNKTYIKPYTGLSQDMILYFQNNKTVTLDNDSVTDYLKITGVNNKFWFITHNTLKETSVLSSITNKDLGMPYKYEIRSFFKTSDENPFTLYSNPYIKLAAPNGEGGSNLEIVQDFHVVDHNNGYVTFWVNDQEYRVVGPSMYLNIATRFVKLKGFYYQHQQASWENYRWVLLDKDYKVLQDTGKKYDKSMEVIFYGLNNEAGNIYYAILLVEDELGNSLSFCVQLTVQESEEIEVAEIPFSAEYDCATRSVKVVYENYGLVKPVYFTKNGQQQIIANIYDKENVGESWDNSVYYGINFDDNMYISGANKKTEVPLFNIDNGYSGFSETNKKGIIYNNFFSKDQESILEEDQKLKINSDNQFLFTTSIKPFNDFRGNLLELNLEKEEEGNQENDNKIKIIFTIDPSEENSIHYYISNSTQKINSRLYSYKTKDDNNNDTFHYFYLLSSFGELPSRAYSYLQTTKNLGAHFVSRDITPRITMRDGETQFDSCVYYKFVNNNQKMINSKKFLGNLCLINNKYDLSYTLRHLWKTTEDGITNASTYISGLAPSYWVENRPLLSLVLDDINYKEKINVSRQIILGRSEKDFQYWCGQNTGELINDNIQDPTSESNEQFCYWNECEVNSIDKDLRLNSWNEILNYSYSEENISDTGMCFVYNNSASFTFPTLDITIRCYDLKSLNDLSNIRVDSPYQEGVNIKHNITDFYNNNNNEKVLSIDVIKTKEAGYGN